MNADKIHELFQAISKTDDITKIHALSNYGASLFNNTKEHYVKCSNDPIYFIENYLKISTPQGEIAFKLFPRQKEYILFATANYEHSKYVKNTRQSGFTTLNCAIIAWRFLFETDKAIAYIGTNQANISHASQIVYKFIGQFIETFKHLYGDDFIVIGNKFNIRGKNGTDIIFISEKQKNAIRGRRLTNVYLDEVEFFDNYEEVIMSLRPAMCCNFKNLICGGTKKGEGWRRILLPRMACFTFNAPDNPTRDLNWVISTIKHIGVDQFEIEFTP